MVELVLLVLGEILQGRFRLLGKQKDCEKLPNGRGAAGMVQENLVNLRFPPGREAVKTAVAVEHSPAKGRHPPNVALPPDAGREAKRRLRPPPGSEAPHVLGSAKPATVIAGKTPMPPKGELLDGQGRQATGTGLRRLLHSVGAIGGPARRKITGRGVNRKPNLARILQQIAGQRDYGAAPR